VLGQPQVVLDQRVLRVVRAADHAAPAQPAAGAIGAGAAEERVGHGLPRRAEVHADARLGVGLGGADLLAELAQELVGRIVRRHLDDAEHALRLVEVGRQRGGPVAQAGPLRVRVEALGRAVERVGVAERPAAHARAGDDRDVAERGQPQDPAHAGVGRVEVAPQIPGGARQFVVGEPAAALEHGHGVALLAQAQGGHAAAEPGPDDQPVDVEIAAHLVREDTARVTGASGLADSGHAAFRVYRPPEPGILPPGSSLGGG
jgi:hypothetical protein